MKTFSTELVNSYADNNYFGSKSTGQSEKRQEALKKAWIEAMAKRGWIIGESILENEKEYLGEVVDLWLEFERDGQLALVEVSK